MKHTSICKKHMVWSNTLHIVNLWRSILLCQSSLILKPFPTCRRTLMHLQQTTFENIVAKEEIAQNKQFLLMPQCFQLLLNYCTPIHRDFSWFCQYLLKVVCCKKNCMWERVNPYQYMTNLLQITLKISTQKWEKSL